MIPLYLKDIAKAAGGKLIGDDHVVLEISSDSRKIGGDCLFIAIKGDKFDGHDFIEKAAANGAVSFICHNDDRGYLRFINDYDNISGYVRVEDTRKALLKIAAYYRSLFNIRTVAVTGSAGKTSVKNGIATILSQKYSVLKTEGNFNNEIGLPLTLFKLDKGHEASVLEMGMNSFGEISSLSKTSKPFASVITNVGTAHIEGLKSREGILKAKLEIIDGMDEGGTLILNKDNDMLRTVNGIKQKIMWFSSMEKADVYIETDSLNSISIRHKERAINLPCESTAHPLLSNIAAAASVGFLFGLTDDEIKTGLLSIQPEKGRLCTFNGESGITVIDDSYNANPESMRLAIDVLNLNSTKGEKVAVLGDMLELGEFSERLHKEVGAYAAANGVHTLITVGSLAKKCKIAFDTYKNEKQRSFHFDNKQDLLKGGFSFSKEQVILVKASRGMELNEIVRFLKTIE